MYTVLPPLETAIFKKCKQKKQKTKQNKNSAAISAKLLSPNVTNEVLISTLYNHKCIHHYMPKSNHKTIVWPVLNKNISYKPVLICVCTVWQAALPFPFSFTFFLRKFLLKYLFQNHLAHSLTKKFLEHNPHAEAAVVIAGHIREVTVQYLISETEQYLISETECSNQMPC